MDIISIILVSIGLAMDAFAVSLGVGTTGTASDARSIFRLSFHFGLFQGLMTLLGWLAGRSIAKYINAFDHWIAFILLLFVGAHMIKEGFEKHEKARTGNPSKGAYMVILSIATSIDALAVGLSMAFTSTPIILSCVFIGFITAGLSYFGLNAGGRLGEKFGKRMEVLCGLILIGIGVRILVEHIWL
jgi:putative Mn2+ efflux pump MntP